MHGLEWSIIMWPYTQDEQTWLVPSKEWTASVMAVERARRDVAGQQEIQLADAGAVRRFRHRSPDQAV
jgi:hypothetical protein